MKSFLSFMTIHYTALNLIISKLLGPVELPGDRKLQKKLRTVPASVFLTSFVSGPGLPLPLPPTFLLPS